MPNWCDNEVTLRHDNPKMIQAVIQAAEAGKLLEFAVSMPEALRQDGVETYGKGEQGEKWDKLRADNLAKYGYKSWYDWSIANWGTKWDVDAEVLYSDDTQVVLRFDSAWSPPVAAYGALERQGFKVDALFVEYDMDFAGHYGNGKERSWTVEQALKTTVGNRLDQTFNVTNVLRELNSEV